MYLVFFFQAEDGIRDGTVTGVQTCALPIYFLATARLVHARLYPRDAGEIDAVLMREEPARINRRGLRPFGQADPFTGEILWRADGTIAANINRRMAEDT